MKIKGRQTGRTLLLFALLSIAIALMYWIQPPVVSEFLSFGDLIDGLIAVICGVVATGFALAFLITESNKCRSNKGNK